MKYTLVSIFQILLILINCQTLTKQDTTIDDKPKEINKSLSKDKKKEIKIYPLHNAVSQGNVTKIQNLIKNKINLDEKDNEGKTAIHYAITKGDLGIINLLIKNKINLDTQDNEGKTALHYAITKDDLDIINLLIKNKVRLQQKDNEGRTALHYATIKGNLEVVKTLIHFGIKNQKIKESNDPVRLRKSLKDELEEQKEEIELKELNNLKNREIPFGQQSNTKNSIRNFVVEQYHEANG